MYALNYEKKKIKYQREKLLQNKIQNITCIKINIHTMLAFQNDKDTLIKMIYEQRKMKYI